MPARDRRGPAGEGPLTGRGLGLCAGDSFRRSRYVCRRPRHGRNPYYGASERELIHEEIDALRMRIEELQDSLDRQSPSE